MLAFIDVPHCLGQLLVFPGLSFWGGRSALPRLCGEKLRRGLPTQNPIIVYHILLFSASKEFTGLGLAVVGGSENPVSLRGPWCWQLLEHQP